MFKLPIPTRLTDYLGEAVVWTVISITNVGHIDEAKVISAFCQKSKFEF